MTIRQYSMFLFPGEKGAKTAELHSPAGICYFDRVAMEMLDTMGSRLTPDIMARIPREEGKAPGSAYYKNAIGRVEADGKAAGKVQRVTLEIVGKHCHREGELYRLPAESPEGVLVVDDEALRLDGENFYRIPSGVQHELYPLCKDKKIIVDVFKFPPDMPEKFREGSRLRLVSDYL